MIYANGGHAGIGKGIGSGDGHAGTVGAEHDGNAGRDQVGGSRDGLFVGRLVVSRDQLDLVGLAVDLNLGANLVGILHAEVLLLAAGTVGTGQRLVNADFDDVFFLAAAAGSQNAECQDDNEGQCDDLFHFPFSSLCPLGQMLRLIGTTETRGVRVWRTSVR